MKLGKYRFDGSEKIDLKKIRYDFDEIKEKKSALVKQTKKNMEEVAELQGRLYAEGREAILICLQALDAAGKDSVVKHVFSSINPQGIEVHSFKSPNTDEASHDFLWRYHKRLPARGKMCIFNRSYYEEVLVVKVHEFWKDYKMPERTVNENYIKNRYKDIRGWEEYLYGNSFRVIKIFLNLSKEEQKRRFLERINREEKNWKFSANDIKERAFFDDYRAAFEDAINATSTKECPWYVLPADKKWYTRYLVSEILLDVMRDINPQYPELDDGAKSRLGECKKKLEDESE